MMPLSFISSLCLLFIIGFFLHIAPCPATRPLLKPKPTLTSINDYNHAWQSFERLLNVKRGSHVSGISELKNYFHHFGYLPLRDFDNLTNTFDAQFESALIRYQAKFALRITGKLDYDTISQITAPRCGLPDTIHKLHATRNYVYFEGKPRWTRHIPMVLTYAFSPENFIKSLSLKDIQRAFKGAFQRWESVIPVRFVETDDYGFSDIKIGFYVGDHGDGEPFDGVLGVLAHSFSPESGRLHLDAAETWAVDFEVEKSKVAVDLESVAVHEIGHLLGLAHSTVKESVMYPSLKPRNQKLDLSVDDIQGVQALYGSNPNFTSGSLLESDISANQAADLCSHWAIILLITPLILSSSM